MKLLVLASMVFAAFTAVLGPWHVWTVDPGPTAGYFTVRAVMLALGVIVLGFLALRGGRSLALPAVLFVAAAVQLGDAVVALVEPNPAVVVLGPTCAALFIVTAVLLVRRR